MLQTYTLDLFNLSIIVTVLNKQRIH
jgi:hypothetical protein